MASFQAVIREKIVQIIERASTTLRVQEVIDRVEEIVLKDGPWSDYALEVTDQHTDPRWKVCVRSMIATMASKGDLVARVSRGVYAPLHLAPEDLAEEEADANESHDEALWLYAFSLPMSPGLLKIGRTGNLERRMQQHRLQHAKAHLPDTPLLEAAWGVSDAHAAEEAVHGLLKLRGKHYRGSGAGREWFRVSVSDVQDMLDIAIGSKVDRADVSAINDL